MDKLLAFLFIVLAASPALSSTLGIRKPRLFGLSSWFGGSEEEEATELPVPDLSSHPLWKVHKYKGISLHPVTLPLEGGSYSPASHTLLPPSAKVPAYPTYAPPAPTYGPPPSTYGPPASFYGAPAQTYGPPMQQPQSQISESSVSDSDLSMGLDALGALASFLPDDSSSGSASGDASTGKGIDKQSLLHSTLKSVFNIKGNLGTAISGLATGKTAALNTLMSGGGGQAALFGLLTQYPQLASFLARKHGSKEGQDMPSLPEIPNLPNMPSLDVMPELPEVPNLKVPPTTYGPPSPPPKPYSSPYPSPSPPPKPMTTYGSPDTFQPSMLPSTEYSSPMSSSTSFATSQSTSGATEINTPQQSYGPPAVPYQTPEPRVPEQTYGTPASGNFQNTEAGFTTVGVQESASSLSPPQAFADQQQQYSNHQQQNLYTTAHFRDDNTQTFSPEVMNTISQFMARNSDSTKEDYVDASRFRPSAEFRGSDSGTSASNFFPIAADYVPPFVRYREDSTPEASTREEVTAPATENAPEEPAKVAPTVTGMKIRDFPISAARAAFNERFRGGKVHIAPGEVTIDTAIKVA